MLNPYFLQKIVKKHPLSEEQAQNLILGKAKNQDGIMIHKGPISLSPKPIWVY